MTIYLVKSNGQKKLVDAASQAAAIRYVIKGMVTAEVVSTTDLVTLMQDEGMKVEKAAQPDTIDAPATATEPETQTQGDIENV